MPLLANGPRIVLLDAQTVGETTSTPAAVDNLNYLTFWITGDGTTSSGVITLEEADDLTPATWSAITTVNASDVTGGATKAVHVSPGCYSLVRARISTVIGGGGTITVVLRGN